MQSTWGGDSLNLRGHTGEETSISGSGAYSEYASTMITLLTCTGDRPRLFHRLECWMARQSLRWTNWIVVDDGVRRTKCTLGQRYIRLDPGLPPPLSYARNLAVGLRELGNLPDPEFIFIIEDDDWYGPDYLASLLVALTTHDLAGESHFRYYNVSERSYYHCRNVHHAAALRDRLPSRPRSTHLFTDRRGGRLPGSTYLGAAELQKAPSADSPLCRSKGAGWPTWIGMGAPISRVPSRSRWDCLEEMARHGCNGSIERRNLVKS